MNSLINDCKELRERYPEHIPIKVINNSSQFTLKKDRFLFPQYNSLRKCIKTIFENSTLHENKYEYIYIINGHILEEMELNYTVEYYYQKYGKDNYFILLEIESNSWRRLIKEMYLFYFK